MRKPKLLTALFIGATLYASVASAQTCLGYPSFAGGSVHLQMAGEFPDSATGYAAAVGAGGPGGLFADLGMGRVSYEGSEEKATFGFLEFGKQFPIGPVEACPVAGGSFAAGPDIEAAGIKTTSSAASAGLALGLPFEASSLLTMIPNVSVRYEFLTQKVDEADIGSVSETFHSGIVDLGLGFVFRDRVSVQPLAHVPFGGTDEEVSFGFFGAVSLGFLTGLP